MIRYKPLPPTEAGPSQGAWRPSLQEVNTPEAILRTTQLLAERIDHLHLTTWNQQVQIDAAHKGLSKITPDAISNTLGVNGEAPLNLTGLIGQAYAPQLAKVTEFSSAPSPNDPVAQDGVLISINGVLYKFGQDGVTPVVQPTAIAALGADIVDTHANRANYPASDYPIGVVFYETDRRVQYINLGTFGSSAWHYLAGVMIALLAARPADLGANDVNFLFIASDTLAFYYWNGTTWVSILAGGTGSPVVTQPSGGGSGDLNGQGLPSQGIQPPPGVPLVAVLPGPGDPLSVLGNKVYIIDPTYFYPLVYTYVPPLSGAGDGWWDLDAVEAPAIFDTFANLGSHNPASYRTGTVFNATDFTVSYVVQIPNPAGVKTWVYYNGIHQDVLANIPATLGANDTGFTFRASDYLHNWRWNGTAWHFTTGGTPSGTVLFSATGAPFGGTGALWHLLDGATVNQSQDNGTTSSVTLETRANNYIAL